MNDENPSLSPTAIALIAHSLWGLYPVLSRLLLTSYAFPPLVLIASAQILAALTGAILSRRHWQWSLLLRPALVGLALVAAVRAILNIMAINYTLAIYVQLINLLAPFVVAMLGGLLFAETPPPHTFKATLIATLGAAIVILGNPLDIHLRWGATDGLGVALALTSVVALALWTQLARLNTYRHRLDPMTVFAAQSSGVVVFSTALSVALGQDWGIWARIPARAWLLYAVIVGMIIIGGNMLQITALSRMKAAFFSSLSAWRLVVALVAAAFLLGEKLTSLWQVFGAAVVMVTVTVYLRQRVRDPYPVDVHASRAGGAPQ